MGRSTDLPPNTVKIQETIRECYVLISGIVHRSFVKQRCTIVATSFRHDRVQKDSEPSVYLEGEGSKTLMLDPSDNKSTHVVLGPYPYGADLEFTFEHFEGGNWKPSRVLKEKVETESTYVMHNFIMLFQLSTVYASTEGDDRVDCEISAFTVV